MRVRRWFFPVLLTALVSPGLASAQTRSPGWNLGSQLSALGYRLDYDLPDNAEWDVAPVLRLRLFLRDHLFLDAAYLYSRARDSYACPTKVGGCSDQLEGDSEVFAVVAGTRFPIRGAEMSLGLSRGHFFNERYGRGTWGLQGTLGTMLSPRFGVFLEYRVDRIEWHEDEVGWNQGVGLGFEVRVLKDGDTR